MDARKNDLLVSAFNEAPNFSKHHVGIHAAASTSYRRNDAERAVGVATVLHFDNRAGSAAGTGVGARLELLFEKDIAAEDFGAASPAPLSIFRELGDPPRSISQRGPETKSP
jgi:hypothetical protein